MRKLCVILLVRCSGDYGYEQDSCIELFKSIFANPIPDNVSIVVWLDISMVVLSEIDHSYRVPPNTNPALNTTRFYSIETLKTPILSVQSGVVPIGISTANFDIKNGTDVQRFFSQVVLQDKYAATENVLFTWGHGASYGTFYDSSPPTPFQKYHMLDAASLRDAINGAFVNQANQKITAVVMMNCFMQFFDACCCLRGAGLDYMVAATTGQDFIGYNYSKIFDYLLHQQGPVGEGLARTAISSIEASGSQSVLRIQNLANATIYATNLSLVSQMGDLLDQLGTVLLDALQSPAGKQQVVNARGTKYINSTYSTIDFFLFVQALVGEFPTGWQQNLLTNLEKLHGQFFIASYLGTRARTNPDHPLGFSVCLPANGTNPALLQFYDTYFNPASPFASPFAHGDWAKFVDEFI